MGETQSRPQSIPTTVGTVVNRPLTTTDPNLSLQNQLDNLRMQQQPAFTNNSPNTGQSQSGRIIDPNNFSSLRQVSSFEINDRNRWERTVVRPVYVKTDRLGMCLLLAQRTITSNENFALRQNLNFFAVQKINPLSPNIDQADDIIYEVSASNVEENIERTILLFRPEEDRVQFIQANGNSYEEPWSVVRQSQDPFDIRALSLFRTDFPEVTRIVSIVPGKKNTVPFFPENRESARRPLPQDEDIFNPPTNDIFGRGNRQQQQQFIPLQQQQFVPQQQQQFIPQQQIVTSVPQQQIVTSVPQGVRIQTGGTTQQFVPQQQQLAPRQQQLAPRQQQLAPRQQQFVPQQQQQQQQFIPQQQQQFVPQQQQRPVGTRQPVFLSPVDAGQVLIQEPRNVLVQRPGEPCRISNNISIPVGKKSSGGLFEPSVFQDQQLNDFEEMHREALQKQQQCLQLDAIAYEQEKNNILKSMNNTPSAVLNNETQSQTNVEQSLNKISDETLNEKQEATIDFGVEPTTNEYLEFEQNN